MADLYTLATTYLNLLTVWFLWAFAGFIVVIKMKKQTTEGTWQRKALMLLFGYPFIIILDWPLNVISSLAYWDWPDSRGELYTDRMIRYKELPPTSFMNRVRKGASDFTCPLLNFIDKGHCNNVSKRII